MGNSRGKSKTKSLKENANSQPEAAEKRESGNEVLNNTDSPSKRSCKKPNEVESGIEVDETLPIEELETRVRSTRGRKSVQGNNGNEKQTRKSGRKTNQTNSYKMEEVNDEEFEDNHVENSNDFTSSKKKKGKQLKNDKNENDDSQSANKSYQSKSKSKNDTQKEDENDNDNQETRKKGDEHESDGSSKKLLKRKARTTTTKSSDSTKEEDSCNEESEKSTSSKKPKKSASSKDSKKSQKSTKISKKTGNQQENKPKEDDEGDNNDDDDDDDDDSSSNASSEEFEVEKLVDIITKKNGKREFLVRWKGYTSKDDTWEPERHLNCKHLIDKFLKKNESKTREMRTNRKVTDRYILYHPGKKLSSRLNRKPRKTYYGTD